MHPTAELVACWGNDQKNYKQKIPRMASLFRGSARQAEERLRKSFDGGTVFPDLTHPAPIGGPNLPALYLKIGAFSRKLSPQREGVEPFTSSLLKSTGREYKPSNVDARFRLGIAWILALVKLSFFFHSCFVHY